MLGQESRCGQDTVSLVWAVTLTKLQDCSGRWLPCKPGLLQPPLPGPTWSNPAKSPRRSISGLWTTWTEMWIRWRQALWRVFINELIPGFLIPDVLWINSVNWKCVIIDKFKPQTLSSWSQCFTWLWDERNGEPHRRGMVSADTCEKKPNLKRNLRPSGYYMCNTTMTSLTKGWYHHCLCRGKLLLGNRPIWTEMFEKVSQT